MFKKLVITGAAAGLLLVSAAGAFASFNYANHVGNNVHTNANTGGNVVVGFGHGAIFTGNASALGAGANVVNTNSGPFSVNTATNVGNTVTTSANTGKNFVTGGFVGTGNASAAGFGLNVVNSNVSPF
jgi:hypothetical protein